jgi:hypothetical protein
VSNATRTDPVAKVHELLNAAEAAGLEPPGRVVLARDTGASDYQIRTVKAERARRAREAAETAGNDLEREAGTEPSADVEAADVNACEPDAPRARFGRRRTSMQVRDAPGGGKAVAWVGFIFGSIVSIAANVLAAWIAPEHAPPGWHPTLAAQIGAAVWPLGLLLAVEVVSRVPRPSTWSGKLALFGGIGVVASGSAVISYGHIRDVLESWQYSPLGAGVGPLVVDGLMMVCGVAMLAKPARTPDVPVVAEPAPEPVLPVSYAALSIANGQPIAPAGDAWRDTVARLAEPGDRG